MIDFYSACWVWHYNDLHKLDILEKFAGYYSFVTQYSIILGLSDINIVNESMLRSYCGIFAYI